MHKKLHKMNKRYQAVAGPAQPKGRARPGPAHARPLVWARLVGAWFFAFTLCIFVHVVYICIYVWYIFFWYASASEKPQRHMMPVCATLSL